MLQARANLIHLQAPMHSVPYWMLKRMMGGFFKTMLPEPLYTQETRDIITHYYALMVQRPSKVEVLINVANRHFAFPYHCMHETDRMMNPNIDFPVAFCFGDRDFFGSEGADAIIEANPHF